MKEMVKIRYQSVISHESEKIKDHCEVEAEHSYTLTKEVWSFIHPTHGEIEIVICGDDVSLTYGISTMKLRLNQSVDVSYATLYGTLHMTSFLKKCIVQKDKLSIIYELYDRQALISKSYLNITPINASIS